MNRTECEVCAPWALRFYDAGAEHERNNCPWKLISDEIPEKDRLLLYYFEEIGIGLGYYHGVNEENAHVFACDHGVSGKANYIFGNDRGWLTDDVTHWMYVTKPWFH